LFGRETGFDKEKRPRFMVMPQTFLRKSAEVNPSCKCVVWDSRGLFLLVRAVVQRSFSSLFAGSFSMVSRKVPIASDRVENSGVRAKGMVLSPLSSMASMTC